MSSAAPIVSHEVKQLLRYGALGSGFVYGLYRATTLRSAHQQAEAAHHRHQQLVQEAERKWSEHVSKEAGLITDPDHADFDLEKVLEHYSKQA